MKSEDEAHMSLYAKSHPARGGWIEIKAQRRTDERPGSHPARGGWIEIAQRSKSTATLFVPPREGWVD